MPNILQSNLKSHKSTVGASLNEWGEKQNTITDLIEDKLNEVIIDLNYITGINSDWDVEEVDFYEDLPLIGNPMVIYYVLDTRARYRWGGTVYVPLNEGSSSRVVSVNSKTGVVVLTKSDIGLSNVDNTSDLTKITATNYSALNTTSKTVSGAINEVKSSTDSKAPTNNPTFTGTVVLPNTTSIGNVDSTEISYLDGVTSGIQVQLNNKQPLDSDLTALADLTSNGIIVRTGSGTATTRSIATSGVGISVTNGDGISANPTIVSNSTSSNTANAIVSRNADGNFNAGTITATLNGSASTLTTPRTIGAMTGDVTSNGSSFNGSANNSNVATIGANKVTNSKLAQMPTMTIKGNDAVGNADPQDLTVSEVQTMIQDSAHRFVTDAEKITWNSTSAVIKYYGTQALAVADESNISLGDYIQTFGANAINDGGGSLYIVASSLTDGFSIGNGKYANYLVNSAKTGITGSTGQQIANINFVNAMLGGNTVPAKNLATNGYVKMANGLILQWGTTAALLHGGSCTFPITFPNSCFNVVLTGTADGNWIVTARTPSGFTYSDASVAGAHAVHYIAIGN